MDQVTELGEAVPVGKRVNRRFVSSKMVKDEDAKRIIRMRIFDKMTISEIADLTGKSESFISGICTGVNRGHLLREVEMEPKPMMG